MECSSNCDTSADNIRDAITRGKDRRRSTDVLFAKGTLGSIIVLSIFNTLMFFYVADHLVKTPGHLSVTQSNALDRIYAYTEQHPDMTTTIQLPEKDVTIKPVAVKRPAMIPIPKVTKVAPVKVVTEKK